MPLLGPHTPIVPNAENHGSSKAGPYGDWVHQMDSILGKVVEVLERTGAIQNTIVLFTSDNGSPRTQRDRGVWRNFDRDGALLARAERTLARSQGRRMGGRASCPVRDAMGTERSPLAASLNELSA